MVEDRRSGGNGAPNELAKLGRPPLLARLPPMRETGPVEQVSHHPLVRLEETVVEERLLMKMPHPVELIERLTHQGVEAHLVLRAQVAESQGLD